MGIKPEDIARAIASGNKVLQQLKRVCPNPDKPTLTANKRIRQSGKPVLNKLEAEWFKQLETRYYGAGQIRIQAKKFKLANGCWYCPDFVVTTKLYGGDSSWETAWEVKGKHAWEDAMVKLKVAAHQWPEVQFILVWKQDGHWQEQVVLP